MSEFKWKPVTWGWCGNCGDDAIEVFTDCEEENIVCDGDKARCKSCGCPGVVSAMEEDEMTINWHDEPGCACQWCKEHILGEEKPIPPIGGKA